MKIEMKVAATVGKGIVSPDVVTNQVIFGALIGAIAWNVITWWYGLPSSSSHALIGGMIGATIAKAGVDPLVMKGILRTVAFIFVSPVLGMLLGDVGFAIGIAAMVSALIVLALSPWLTRMMALDATETRAGGAH